MFDTAMPAFRLALLATGLVAGGPAASEEDACQYGWVSINEQVLMGKGRAAIADQCRKDEDPCPSAAELTERARNVAQARALADWSKQRRANVRAKVTLIDGTSGEMIEVTSSSVLPLPLFCERIEEGVVETRALATVRLN